MKNRLYFRSSVKELETVFLDSPDDQAVCQRLLEELEFRTTAKASALKERIRASAPKASSRVSAETTAKARSVQSKAAEAAIPQVPKPAGIVKQSIPQPKYDPGPKPPVTNDTQNILRAWTALEVLSPQGYKREAELAGGQTSRIASITNAKLPWEAGEKSLPKKRLFYELILGTINLGPAVEALLKLYSDNRPDAPRVTRRSPIACILLDKEGRPLDEDTSFAISSFSWGVPIALQGDLKLLAQWPSEEPRLIKSFRDDLFEYDEDGEILPLTKQSIESLYSGLVSALNLEGHDISPPHFAIRQYTFYASKVPPEPSLLNSFFLDDLAKARELAEQSSLPLALSYYLGQSAPTHRTDLLKDQSGLRDILQPKLTPLGKWPGLDRFPLALLQQAAVNGTATGLRETGILSVNGPPGTGKTTLLRDVVAARIVERATIMAEYERPETAFTATAQNMQRSGAKITLHRVDERLKGFEMVVASSNNKAVENVSAELPALDAIADDASGLRYFSSISDKLLGQETWGAVAAVLGNSSNRWQFSQAFWRDEECGLSTYLNHATGLPQFASEPQENDPPVKRPRTVVVKENPPANRREAQARWDAAREGFAEALGLAQKTQDNLQRIHVALAKTDELSLSIRDIKRQITELDKAHVALLASKHETDANLKVADDLIDAIREKQSLHGVDKPGLLARFFRTKTARAWRQINVVLVDELKAAEAQSSTILQRSETIAQRVKTQQDELASLKSEAKEFEAELEALNTWISGECANKNIPIPNADFFDGTHDEVQVANLWFEKAENRQREDVFEAAMAVHRAFIDCAADPLRQNLAIFTESFGTRSLGTPQKDQLIADLWATFFLVVPVVSTTFASVNRMFSRLPTETLGWLLVDEAGQALPQAAVGAIMRSKRAVVVGDPLQIEPVVTLPNTLTEEICGFFGIDALKYNAPEASVQTVADAASPYCAQFPVGSGHRDVGAPLLVHRRCDSPMFEISNEIAYSNLMVHAKEPKDKLRPLGPSGWVHVVGKPGPDKWCEDEGVKLIELLKALRASGEDSDIYVVTPFVIVQDNLRRMLRESGVLDGWVDNTYSWINAHVGTVHTVQGREAGTVFFVLGAQEPSQNGARAWAGEKPNLVNVAVTRAKSSLYVIGNRDLWRSAGVFATLDRFLRVSVN